MLKLPLSILPVKNLRKISYLFLGVGETIRPMFPFLKKNLEQAEIEFDVREYLTMCVVASALFFLFIGTIITFGLYVFGVEKYHSLGPVIAFVFTIFVLFQQTLYPKLIANRRIKNIERNLLSALQNMLVQLNSGIPLFQIIVNISRSDYGEISREFAKAVREINAGKSQIEVLDEIAAKNPSLFFRRAIWQLVNGMKAGSDISTVIKSSIDALSEEQLLQIRRYGGQLSPLAMFYMLIAVIMPALGITFIIVLSSFIAPSESLIKMIFFGLYGFIVFFQIMFLGLIKSRRPNLLGE